MNPWLRILGSLQLTAWLLAASLVLVFFGTIEQVHLGLYGAQRVYFESFVAIWAYPPQWPLGQYLAWLHLPVPGGYLLGPLLLANLAAAHFRYFQRTWKAAGIVLIHAGVAMLLVGQLATNLFQEESFLWLQEGGSSNYLVSFHEDELALTDTSGEKTDKVFSLAGDRLTEGRHYDLPGTGLGLRLRAFYRNATLAAMQGEGASVPATQGLGKEMNLVARPAPEVTKMNERNAGAALVEVLGPQGPLGVWLVSALFENQFPPQTFEAGGKSFRLEMRPRRTYLPFRLTLIDFTHDKYPGTEIPRNFASTIRLQDERHGTDRQALISMNNPLRYEGLAFYQASFAEGDTASMLQVVRNPSWLLPYLSCTLVTAGLLFQFGRSLWGFLRRRAAGATGPDPLHEPLQEVE